MVFLFREPIAQHALCDAPRPAGTTAFLGVMANGDSIKIFCQRRRRAWGLKDYTLSGQHAGLPLQRIEEVPFGMVMSEFNDTTPAAVPRSPTLVTEDDISGSLAVPRLPARTCAGCGAPGAHGGGTCAACRTVNSCSKACQKGHWAAHKAACRAATAAAAAAAAGGATGSAAGSGSSGRRSRSGKSGPKR